MARRNLDMSNDWAGRLQHRASIQALAILMLPLRWVGMLPLRQRADMGQVCPLARLHLGCSLSRQSVERRNSSTHEKPSAVRLLVRSAGMMQC